jgi:hypothetical protein
MRPSAAATFMLLGLGLSTTVQAGTLSFDSIVGNWTGATGGAAVSGLNSNQLRWGNAITSHGQSGYDFDAAGPFSAATGTDFSLGEFTHLNRTIASGGSISAAVLSISYAFRLSDDPGTVINRNFDVDFAHLETFNYAATCADGAANGVGVNGNGCADRVTMGALSDIVDTFTIGNIVYKLTLKGFEPGGTFWTEENKTSTSRLMGHFSATTDQTGGGGPSPVPLPASGLLLLAALGGLAWRRS